MTEDTTYSGVISKNLRLISGSNIGLIQAYVQTLFKGPALGKILVVLRYKLDTGTQSAEKDYL